MFKIRLFIPQDLNFIFNSWLKSYRFSLFSKNISDKDYFKYHHLLIEEILARPTTSVLVACDKLDENVIFGYLVTEKSNIEDHEVLHYSFVKQSFQHLGEEGVFPSLVKAAHINLNEAIYTHMTRDFEEYILKKHPSMRYIPYLV